MHKCSRLFKLANMFVVLLVYLQLCILAMAGNAPPRQPNPASAATGVCSAYDRSLHCEAWTKVGCGNQRSVFERCPCSCLINQSAPPKADPVEPIIGWDVRAACLRGHNDLAAGDIVTDTLYECVNHCQSYFGTRCRSAEWRKLDGYCTLSTDDQYSAAGDYHAPCYNVDEAGVGRRFKLTIPNEKEKKSPERCHTWFATRHSGGHSSCGVLYLTDGSPFAKKICEAQHINTGIYHLMAEPTTDDPTKSMVAMPGPPGPAPAAMPGRPVGR